MKVRLKLEEYVHSSRKMGFTVWSITLVMWIHFVCASLGKCHNHAGT